MYNADIKMFFFVFTKYEWLSLLCTFLLSLYTFRFTHTVFLQNESNFAVHFYTARFVNILQHQLFRLIVHFFNDTTTLCTGIYFLLKATFFQIKK